MDTLVGRFLWIELLAAADKASDAYQINCDQIEATNQSFHVFLDTFVDVFFFKINVFDRLF